MCSDKVIELQQELYEIKSILYLRVHKKEVEDAEFAFNNGLSHYNKHMTAGELPKNMTFEQYVSKAKQISMKAINGSSVKAYKYQGNRTAKSDGQWFVSYIGGIGGKIITAFPLRGGFDRFYKLMKNWYGTELNKE